MLALLAPALEPPGAILLDATLGRAGHASALLSEHPGLTLIGVDTDEAAIEASRLVLAPYRNRVTLVHAVYDEIPAILTRLRLPSVHGILFDLGVSSPQLDDPERGFAYSYDAPLDMRMDRTGPLTAADVVNTYSAGQAGPGAARVRGGALRAPDRRRRRPGSLPGPVHLHDAAGRDSSVTRSPRRPGGTAATRPSARSRPCGSR